MDRELGEAVGGELWRDGQGSRSESDAADRGGSQEEGGEVEGFRGGGYWVKRAVWVGGGYVLHVCSGHGMVLGVLPFFVFERCSWVPHTYAYKGASSMKRKIDSTYIFSK